MKISVANSRMEKSWKNTEISWEDFCARCSTTIRTTETVEEYRKLKKGQQDSIKDVGGFVVLTTQEWKAFLLPSRKKNSTKFQHTEWQEKLLKA